MIPRGGTHRAEGDCTPFTVDGQHTDINLLLVACETAWSDEITEYLTADSEMTVTQVADASAALDRLDSEHSFECLVCDFESLEMSGIEFLASVRAGATDIPCLLCVQGESPQLTQQALRIGADDIVRKDLVSQCRELLASRITTCVSAVRREQSFETLRRAIESAGHAVLITDRTGTITYANPAMVEISGYSADTLVGNRPSMLQSGEHDEAFYADLWETILDGEVWHGEVINEREDGKQYVIDQTIAPMTDASGTITGFVAINREISERIQRERNLTFFQQAVDQIGTGMAAYDRNGVIQYANKAYAEMLGTTPSALEGINVAALNPQFENARFDEYWDSFAAGETQQTETVHRRFDDNETFPVHTTTTHVAVGDEEYHIGTIRDITERKERERDLRLFRQAVEHAGHAVLITDSDGVIQYTNPAFEEITGYSDEEALGKTPAILNSGEHDEAFYADLWETILDGEVWEGELINERKDGERFHIEQTIAPLTDGEEEITHFVGINNDITEMKEYERELEKQNERLEQFGRTVAHDLRNPLNVIRVTLRDAREADDPKEAHAQIADSIDRMETLIDELLMLAKQGQTVLDPSPVSLESVTREAWNHVQTAAMSLTVADDPKILVDESRVCELFENLFRNACEHAGADARLTVGSCSDGFYVADDGPGIPPQDRNRVLDSGFTTSKEGTGFGLSIVQQIASAHDWNISVVESDDGGARFEFRSVEFE